MQRTLVTVTRDALMRTALCILFLTGFPAAPVFSQPAVSQQEIEEHKIQYLISAVADLKDARFLRNGSEYDAQRAADHLRLKLRYAGDRVKTAEDFIVYCATASSMSGEKIPDQIQRRPTGRLRSVPARQTRRVSCAAARSTSVLAQRFGAVGAVNRRLIPMFAGEHTRWHFPSILPILKRISHAGSGHQPRIADKVEIAYARSQ